MPKQALLLSSLLVAVICQADVAVNVGDVLDGGASVLSKSDVESQLIGSWITFTGNSGAEFNLNPMPEGNVRGQVRGFKATAPGRGSWKLGDDGKLCIDFHFAFGSLVGDYNRCQFWLTNGKQYWAAGSATDRAAPVLVISSVKK